MIDLKKGAGACDLCRWSEYEATLSEAYRNREGIYYTPESIVEEMLAMIEDPDIASKTLLDPCCGSGNFIIGAIKRGIPPQNIYGYDIDPNGVEITKRRIEELTGYQSPNIIHADFLEVADGLPLRVDYIFTNPPWGRKADREKQSRVAAKYGARASADSSTLFIYAALLLLKEGGAMGLLLQEAFFNIASYAEIRRLLLEYRIEHLIDYGRAFKTILTKACAIILTKTKCDGTQILCQSEGRRYTRTPASFVGNPHQILNFRATPEESEVVEMLLQRPHTTLKGRARWGMGIVTGDNNRFCSDTPKRGFEAIYRGSDITKRGFKAPALYINSDLSLYQQAAPAWIYRNSRKIVYRFIASDLCFLCDSGGSLILNSANMFLLDDEFPISEVELAKLLNSRFTNWLFKVIFSTHKILRGDLEQLPLFLEYLEEGQSCDSNYLKHLGIVETEAGSYCLSKIQKKNN